MTTVSKENRLTIISGTDKAPLVRLRNSKTGDPIDLTNATLIQAKFKKRNRADLILSDTQKPAVKAQATYETVVFTAGAAGAAGNGISLSFNGVDDIDTVVQAWNTANPGNTVEHNGTGTDVLASGSVDLTGGYDAYFPVEVSGDPKLGKIVLRLLEADTESLKRGPNQTFTVTIDIGENPGGDRLKAIFHNLDVIDDN